FGALDFPELPLGPGEAGMRQGVSQPAEHLGVESRSSEKPEIAHEVHGSVNICCSAPTSSPRGGVRGILRQSFAVHRCSQNKGGTILGPGKRRSSGGSATNPGTLSPIRAGNLSQRSSSAGAAAASGIVSAPPSSTAVWW